MFNNYNPYAFGNAAGWQRPTSQFPSQPYLKGRLVTSVDEVRAAQVDLDGTATYFASPGEAKIYVKGIDMQGLPYIQVYELQKNPTGANEIEARIMTLENRLKELESYVQHAADNANAG